MSDKKKPGKPVIRREYCISGAAMEKDLKIRIDGRTFRQLNLYAKRERITRAAAVRRILRQFLQTYDEPGADESGADAD